MNDNTNGAEDPFGGEFSQQNDRTDEGEGQGVQVDTSPAQPQENAGAAADGSVNGAAADSAAGGADGAKSGKAEGGAEGAEKKKRAPLWQKPDPMPKSKYSRSFRIALSAISCAFAVVFLTLGLLSNVLVATGYIIAEIALMVPLSKRFYLGDFLAYLGTVLLAVLFGAIGQFWNLIPFIMFFGLHPLVNSFQLRYKVNKWLALAVKMVWFDVTLYVMYLIVFGGVLGGSFGQSAFFDFVNNYIWLFIIVLGSLFLWFYDYVMFRAQGFVNMLVAKIKK